MTHCPSPAASASHTSSAHQNAGADPTSQSTLQDRLRHSLEHATHLLPSQGPISVFVHHNTLHAFEQLAFEHAVVAGGELYHCEPYLTEERFHQEMASGRIGVADLETALLDDLGDEATRLVASFGTRFALRLAMLQYPLRSAPAAELHWLIAESAAHTRFRDEVPPEVRQRLLASTRRWLTETGGQPAWSTEFDWATVERSLQSGPEAQLETLCVRQLWRVCQAGVERVADKFPTRSPASPGFQRLRDVLWQRTGRDSDRLVNEELIRFTAAFLDQGFADWELPHREEGYFAAFAQLYASKWAPSAPWLRSLRDELRQIIKSGVTPLQSLADSLREFAVDESQIDDLVLHSLLALRGWAGLVWQMEANAPWTPRPAPRGTLTGFLAVRLLLERHALAYLVRQEWPQVDEPPLQQLLRLKQPATIAASEKAQQQAFTLFQLAQVRGWSPAELIHLAPEQWRQLLCEIEAFSHVERRRVFHLAYEHRYRQAALNALVHHRRRQLNATKSVAQAVAANVATEPHTDSKPAAVAFQVVCCIDDREESFRRHLEEVDPECQTFGAAGFFAVAMYYQGAAEAHYRPLCPIIITPQHYVREEPVFSATIVNAARTQRRRLVGQMTHQVHARSRTLLGGIVTGVLGSLATFPLVARILAPRLTAQLRNTFGSLVRPPATELHIERVAEQPGSADEALGYSLPEMAAIVKRILQDIGLVRDFAPIVLFIGHGSSSLNNPHESAYNCGACSGGRGGPNARSFALMANDPRVRLLVAQQGIEIPAEVRFVGAYHNTCDDHLDYYDLDQLPRTHRALFRRAEQSLNQARARNAHERARRFESAPLHMTAEQALEHVEERAEDLSQARPEYNHATNAACFVGRRAWSRGLFLDRRVFLTSYDPSVDDAQGTILERILAAVIPVCAGISLEYLFSTIDNEGYGCGSKLPHNIAAMVGVMTGAASDVRPGLSAQMVEIHEPMRILFVIETSAKVMQRIMQSQPAIDRLVRNGWVQLAVFDAAQNRLCLCRQGEFVPTAPAGGDLPVVKSSLEWYGGQRQHLGFATIEESQLAGKRAGEVDVGDRRRC